MKASRILIWIGSGVLAATAAFHATGYATVLRDTSAVGVSVFLRSAARGLWLYASFHWLFIAGLAVVASLLPTRLSRVVLSMSAFIIAGDAVLLLVFVGPFMGELLLASVTVAYAAGAILQSRVPEK